MLIFSFQSLASLTVGNGPATGERVKKGQV
jgi:hypothetical protein